ncbi:MAG: LamG domain-containing protein [Phycisphaerae bacterium]|jgi:hypothetical protein|nr:LamG domain-containing protein [Phycisphaerae bacterium]
MDCLKTVDIIGIACLWVFAASASPAGGDVSGRNLPSKGLVAMWSGQGNAADSAGENHGRASGGVKYAPGISGLAFKLDGKGAHINIGSPAALQITGDQTIAMWLKPERLGVRRNPIAKAYGGEMTITLEIDGGLTYFYGTHGRNAHPYDHFLLSGNVVKIGRWTHVAVVRDFKTHKLRWYINGILKLTRDARYDKARASNLPLYIGRGYLNTYCGLIDEVCIWNRALSETDIGAVVASAPQAAPVILRNAKLDNIRLLDGSVLFGTFQNQDWSITTLYGKFKVPADRVVGLASRIITPAATSQPVATDVRMLLVDGQVLVGRITEPHIQLKLTGGHMLKIPLDQTRQCAYRISAKKPAGAGEARKADAKFPATVVLSSGDHLVWNCSGTRIRFKSLYGPLDIRAEIVSSIAPAGSNMWRVSLKDSSLIQGTMASGELKLKLELGKEISIPSRNIMHLTMSGAITKPTDSTAVLLRGGDFLVGRLSDKVLIVRTAYGTVNIPTADVWAIESPANGAAKLTMQNLTVLRGQLMDKTLDVVLASGLKLSVRADRIISVTAPRKLPTEIVRKIEALIKELGDTSATKRKAAVKKLVAMGKGVIVVLKRHSNSKNATIRKGVKEVIGALEGTHLILVKPEIIIQDEVELDILRN